MISPKYAYFKRKNADISKNTIVLRFFNELIIFITRGTFPPNFMKFDNVVVKMMSHLLLLSDVVEIHSFFTFWSAKYTLTRKILIANILILKLQV